MRARLPVGRDRDGGSRLPQHMRGSALGAQQRPLDAAALFGAGLRHAANVQMAFIGSVLALAHAHVERARDTSAPQAFDQALQHGHSLTLEEAAGLAQALIEAACDQPKLVLYSAGEG